MTENNWPAEPSIDNVPFDVGYAFKVIGKADEVFAAVNIILGSSVDELVFGVINIFLSEFAIFYPVTIIYLLNTETTA